MTSKFKLICSISYKCSTSRTFSLTTLFDNNHHQRRLRMHISRFDMLCAHAGAQDRVNPTPLSCANSQLALTAHVDSTNPGLRKQCILVRPIPEAEMLKRLIRLQLGSLNGADQRRRPSCGPI